MDELTEQPKHSPLHWYKIPGGIDFLPRLPEGSKNNFFKVYGKYMSMLLYYANNYIADMDSIKFNQKQIDTLNKHGLHIFLYEPLCSYHVDSADKPLFFKYSMGFYSEFDQPDQYQGQVRAAELDSIENFMLANKLINVTVHTGDYDADKYYTCYPKEMKLICDDFFVKGLTVSIDKFYPKKIIYKFLSLNWRYTPSRNLICSKLNDLNLINPKTAKFSWYFNTPSDKLLTHVPWIASATEQFKQDVYDANERLNLNAPYCLDLNTRNTSNLEIPGTFYPEVENYTESNPVHLNLAEGKLNKEHSQCAISIVTESRFAQPTANISEKVLTSMVWCTPFLLVAPPYSLRYMKEEFGFKTFDKWWDESYDNIENHKERLTAIYSLIDELNAKDLSELTEMVNDMKDVLIHNFNRCDELNFIMRGTSGFTKFQKWASRKLI